MTTPVGAVRKDFSMKKRIFVLIALLLALHLAGCSGSDDWSYTVPDESSQKSTSEKPKDDRTEAPETSTTETAETRTTETEPSSQAMSITQALQISIDECLDADGAYGLETTWYDSSRKRIVALVFEDRAYELIFQGDFQTEQGTWTVHRNTYGQYWLTLDYFGYQPPSVPSDGKTLFAYADVKEMPRRTPAFAADLRGTLFYILRDYDLYIKDDPEQVDWNGIPCWRFTAVEEYIAEYSSIKAPKDSIRRSYVYFRQDNWHFVYEQTDIVAPDGTAVPEKMMRAWSGKEARDFYAKKAELFSDVDVRDIRGEHTLTVVLDPGESTERTIRCPMNSDEKFMTTFQENYHWYTDRAGTEKADLWNIVKSGRDATVYAIKDK